MATLSKTDMLMREVGTRAVEVTSDNLAVIRRLKRNKNLRLRRWTAADVHGCENMPYPLLRDLPAGEQPQLGDVLVSQADQVG